MKKAIWISLIVLILGITYLTIFKKPVGIGIKSSIIKSEKNAFNLSAELKNIDLSTPEKAMDFYIKSLKIGDRKGLAISFGSNHIVSEHWKPEPIKSYEIKKKTIYSKEYIDDLIKKGWMPSPPHLAGDVELQVKEIYSPGISVSGTYTYKGGEEEMFTYWFRKSGKSWFLKSHCSWNEY